MVKVGNVLRAIDADVVNIVEVEDCTVLGRMIRDYAWMPNVNYSAYMIKGKDTSTGQNVAMLTRVSPLDDLQRTEERAEYPVAASKCRLFGSTRDTAVSKVSPYRARKPFARGEERIDGRARLPF